MSDATRKRVLVTGGAGFVGSHLCERILANGDEVLCIDNFYTGSRTNVTHLFDNPNFELLRHDVTFPLFAKIDVNGEDRNPLYAWLTGENTEPEGPGDVKWNFGKFLIDRGGQVVARFEPATEPEAEDVVTAVEAALG